MLPDPYPVKPWTAPCQGEVRLPGSKSLTNRALLVAAMCDGAVRLQGSLFSRDTSILMDSLVKLGFDVRSSAGDETIEIDGLGGNIPRSHANIHVGNAGTAARFLAAFVCLHPDGEYHFDGDEEMRKRPMGGLLDTLESLGARFEFKGEHGCFPFCVRTNGLSGGRWEIDASASSQMLSALMLVAPKASGPVTIDASGTRPAFVEMTAGLMKQFNISIEGDPGSGYQIPGEQSYVCPDDGAFWIEPDVTAASYFMVLPLVVGGSLRILGMRNGMLQGDTAFASVMTKLGMQMQDDGDGWTVSYIETQGGARLVENFRTFSDTFLTLAAISPLLTCPVRIDEIGHTRFQETDRIDAVTTELKRIGAVADCGEDHVEVCPFPAGYVPPAGSVVQTYRDHRVAMSFAMLGCSPRFGSSPWLSIADPGCCGKTFPAFFEVLESLYRYSHDKE
ncbi:MAG: 3-phosphoshikimate 1-carboxyvinyltransferase [Puniceicoccaceae bacterium]